MASNPGSTSNKKSSIYKPLRAVKWFCYRYWWLVLLSFLLFLLLFFLFCNNRHSNISIRCDAERQVQQQLNTIDELLANCCGCQQVQIPDTTHPPMGTLIDSGLITITLLWQTIDDLDLAVQEPSGNLIWYKNNSIHSASGGFLDIDMNRADPLSETPVEHIVYRNEPPHGRYKVLVTYYKKNSSATNVPYDVHVKIGNSYKLLHGFHSVASKTTTIYEFDYP